MISSIVMTASAVPTAQNPPAATRGPPGYKASGPPRHWQGRKKPRADRAGDRSRRQPGGPQVTRAAPDDGAAGVRQFWEPERRSGAVLAVQVPARAAPRGSGVGRGQRVMYRLVAGHLVACGFF